MIPSLEIGNLEISPGLVLSPMSGVTCSSFRRLIKELNPGAVGLVVSEFVSVEGMTRFIKRTLEMMEFHESERPYGIQIFGYDVDRMKTAAQMVQDAGADLVDINCGCPAPKVVRKGGGCELMRQPEHLQKIFSAVRNAVSIPVTMKMRSGWDSGSTNCLDIAKMAEAEGLNAVAIHGRTRVQLYRGEADWSFVKEVSSVLKIPVLGSGDVVDNSSALQKLGSGVSGLHIGRAALWNPFVFSEIHRGVISPGRHPPIVIGNVLRRYAELLVENHSEKQSIGKMKQLTSQMARGWRFRKDVLLAQSFREVLSILSREDESVGACEELHVFSS